MEVILSPPPDFVVSGLFTNDFFYTGDSIQVYYNVTNEGAGAPFERFWVDQIVGFVVAHDVYNYYQLPVKCSIVNHPSKKLTTHV